MLTYHFISPSNPVNPENFLILGAKIRRKNVISKFFAENFSFLLRILWICRRSYLTLRQLAVLWYRLRWSSKLTSLAYEVSFVGHWSLLRFCKLSANLNFSFLQGLQQTLQTLQKLRLGTEKVRSRSCFKRKERIFFKPVFLSKPSVLLPHIAVLLLSAVFRQVYDAIWRNIHDSSSL